MNRLSDISDQIYWGERTCIMHMRELISNWNKSKNRNIEKIKCDK